MNVFAISSIPSRVDKTEVDPSVIMSPPASENKKITLPIMEGLWADMTLQFGAGKLMSAWKQAGKPTDSVSIANMLSEMGMTVDNIKLALSNAGMSAADVESTIDDLHHSGEDIEIPFVSGVTAWDKEAKRIIMTKGKDAFVTYWEGKIEELKNMKANASTASATSTATGAPPSPNLTSTPDDEFVNKIQSLLDAKDFSTAKSLIMARKLMGKGLKAHLGLLLRRSSLTDAEKSSLSRLIQTATVAEMDEFYSMSAMLIERRLTWQDLGFRYIIKERRSNCVVMI